MKRYRLATCALLLVANAASAATHYLTPQDESELLHANIERIRDCLGENKGSAAENCIGVTKSYCMRDVPTCNLQEAAAWDALAIEKRASLKKSQGGWQRQVRAACAYRNRAAGYQGIHTPEAWEEGIAPTGCVLQRSARRVLGLRGKRH